MTTMPAVPTVPRTLDLRSLLPRKSHFLLGFRQTGKTFLIRKTHGDVRVYDLLDSATSLR
jgi:predicted AAA+ superfamily ATPase